MKGGDKYERVHIFIVDHFYGCNEKLLGLVNVVINKG